MLCDSTAVMQFAKHTKFHKKTKHIKRHYDFMGNATKEKEVSFKYVSKSRMIVDPLTKPIPRDAFKDCVMSLGLHRT